MDLLTQSSPLNAPLWRKLLPIRVLIVSAIVIAVTFLLIGQFESAKIGVAQWVEKVFMVVAGLPILAFVILLVSATTDLAVHFLPEGKLKKSMVGREKSSEELAKEFSERAYSFVLIPLYVWAGLLAVIIGTALLLGGVTLLSTLFGSISSGWSSWAIAIVVLLVLLLLKK